MSEFEKELEKNMKLNKVAYERENIYSDFLVSKRDIERIFEEWQTPKPLVEVPRIVADWFEDRMLGSFSAVVASYSFNDGEAITWVHDNGGLDLLCKMKLYGYTVEKEKKYILKHIDLSEQYKNESLYLSRSCYAKLKHEGYLKDVDMSKIKQCHFTQSEIDKLHIGSYEQIEVNPRKTQKLS